MIKKNRKYGLVYVSILGDIGYWIPIYTDSQPLLKTKSESRRIGGEGDGEGEGDGDGEGDSDVINTTCSKQDYLSYVAC